MNGRDVCKKHTNGCNCLGLDVDELDAAATELRTLANGKTKAGFDVLVVSVGGKQSDLYVKMAELNCPFIVGGTHASTWAVRYPSSWDTKDAQIAASHKCVNAMGKFFFNHLLTSTPTSLFENMCAAPLVGMVQSGTDQEVLDKAAAAHSAHCSKQAAALHKEKNDDGKSVHAVKMQAVGAAKRKFNGHADEETANYQCPNCLKYYFYATPLEKNGQKRKHQRCGNKSQLVPYP